jgi:hypothetical protein
MKHKYIFLPALLLFGLFCSSCNNKDNPVTAKTVGSIIVSSIPDSAQIWLDSTYTGKITPDTLTNVGIGTHTIVLKLTGYLNDTNTVNIKEGLQSTSRILFTDKSAATISVISPKAGDVYNTGSTVNIQWTSTGIQNVKIEFTTNNGLLQTDWFTLVNSTPSNGTFPTTFSVPSNQYRIRISEAVTGSPMAYSQGSFTISTQTVKTIDMVSPIGGEHWIVGSTYQISWVSTNIDSVNLNYTIDGGANWKIIASNIPSNSFYKWVIPATAFSSDNCFVRVSDAKQENLSAQSHAPFSIYPSKVLKVLKPNGGEIITSDTLTITWLSSGIANVNLDITRDMGFTWTSIISNLRSTGAYSWIPLPMDPPSSMVRIRITDSSDSTVTDMSDDNFYIGTIAPLTLLTPIGNNRFSASSGLNISWEGIGIISSVNLEYSVNNGRSWNIIADNISCTPNKVNTYLWNGIPNNAKGNILIRVSDSKGRYSDRSGKISID